MKFIETTLPGAYLVKLEKREDERGFFARAWCQNEFEELGLTAKVVQCNLSFNPHKGTLRGMHFQMAPYAETKLLRCTKGAIFDVIIDVRPNSPTYKQWIGVELTQDNRDMLFVPEGFAHGFQTLQDDSEVFYQVSEFYRPGAERGIRWNDSSIGIQWPTVPSRIVSPKDQEWPDFDSVGVSQENGVGVVS